MTYAIFNGATVVSMTLPELIVIFGRHDAVSLVEGHTVKACWRIW